MSDVFYDCLTILENDRSNKSIAERWNLLIKQGFDPDIAKAACLRLISSGKYDGPLTFHSFSSDDDTTR